MLIGSIAQRVKLVKDLHRKGHSQNEISLITGAAMRSVKKYIDMPEESIPAEKQTARGRGHEEAVEKLRLRAETVRMPHKDGLINTEISQKTGFAALTVRNYLSDDFSPVNRLED